MRVLLMMMMALALVLLGGAFAVVGMVPVPVASAVAPMDAPTNPHLHTVPAKPHRLDRET